MASDPVPFTGLVIQWASWGISDSRFSGIPNSFQEIVNCDIRSEPNSIKLNHCLVKDTGTVIDQQINCMLSVSTTGDIMAFGNTGWIFLKQSGTWTKIYTMASNVAILSCQESNGFVYRCTATKIHRTALATILPSFTPTAINWNTFSAGDTENHPILVVKDLIFFGDGKYVAHYDGITFTGTYFTMPSNEQVVALTLNGSAIRVYTKLGVNDYGYCYYWNGSAGSTGLQQLQMQELTGKVLGVATKDSVDYMIMGNTDTLLYYYPFQKQGLKRLSNTTIYYNNVIVYKNYITFWRKWGVYTWWAYSKDYPEVLNYEYKTSNNNNTDDVTSLLNANGVLYVAWKNGTSYGIDKLSTTAYYTSGYVITKVTYGTAMWKVKTIGEVFMTTKALASTENIKIYYNKDDSGAYTLSQTISWPRTEITTWIWAFSEYFTNEIKVELNGDWTTTPQIDTMYFNIIQSK